MERNNMKSLETVLDFGKYKGKTLEEVADIDPSYICWLHENVKTVRIPKWFAVACEGAVREEDEELYGDMYSAMEGFYQGN